MKRHFWISICYLILSVGVEVAIALGCGVRAMLASLIAMTAGFLHLMEYGHFLRLRDGIEDEDDEEENGDE